VALTGVSLGFLADERAAQANIDSACPGGKTCLIGFDAHSANARLYRDFGLVIGMGVAGVLGMGAGIAGFVAGPKRDSIAIPRTWVGPRAAGLGWERRF
jgi:hypothetical protein